MVKVQKRVIQAGGWSWAWFLPAALPKRGKDECVAYFRSPATKALRKAAIQMSMAHTETRACDSCPGTLNFTSVAEDIATFLLVRGKYAWLGAGWGGCNVYPPYPEEFKRDFGTPVEEAYSEVGSSGIFKRQWTKAMVQFDCASHTGAIFMAEP